MPAFIHYPFESERLFQGHGYAAARRAVLWPVVLAGARAAKDPKPKLADAYRELHAHWNRRVLRLSQAGWSATRSLPGGKGKDADPTKKGKYRYVCLANCPPFAVRTRKGERGHECNRARVCPMCFARRVVIELYKAMAYAFFPDDGGRQNKRLGIVACRRTFEVGLSERDIDGWLREVRSQWFNESDLVPTRRGSAVLTTIEPAKKPNKLVVVRSTILLVPQAVDLGALRAKGKLFEVASKDVTKKEIAKVVSWAAKYPLGMLYGDPQVTVAIYEAAAANRAKMFTTSGLLRNNQARQPAVAAGASELD